MKTPILYVTRDIERALGFATLPAGYAIVANHSAYGETIQAKWPEQVLLVRGETPLDTIDLLQHPATEAFVKNMTTLHGKMPAIVVFKNTTRIERYVAEKKWHLLNPSAALAEQIENKISQVSILGSAARFLVPGTSLSPCWKLAWDGVPFVLQYGHGHTGEGTVLVNSSEQLAEIQQRFPQREVRVSPFVKGTMYTSNNCVVPKKRTLKNMFGLFSQPSTLVGNISQQITGLAPFTDLPFSTVGNDWTKGSNLSPELRRQYEDMARACGARLASLGWKGLFGIDAILEESTQRFFLIEINARQPASTTFESELQNDARNSGTTPAHRAPTLTTFEVHLGALTDELTSSAQLQKITDGGQVIQRLTAAIAAELQQVPDFINTKASALRAQGYNVIEYDNNKPNSDLLRIQSKKGIIDSPLCTTPHTN